ncbi:MAG: HD domain-containing protein [Haloarculaceae archaeon]
MTDASTQVERAFPELEAIDAEPLRAGVERAWTLAIEENEVDDFEAVPWFPPAQSALGIDDEPLVAHVRDVTAGARALAEVIEERRGTDVDHDLVVAGALVHDVSKLYEYHGMAETEVGDLLGHPYYGVYVAGKAGLSPRLAHVCLSHTHRTNVEPAFLEAVVVRRADEAAAAAIRAEAVDDLRDA